MTIASCSPEASRGTRRRGMVAAVVLLAALAALWLAPSAGAVSFSRLDFNVGGNTNAIALGDFNRDAKQDVVAVQNFADVLSVQLGTGSGTLGPETEVPFATGPQDVAVGDFDRDGRQDLAAVRSSIIGVYRGTGSGGFGAQTNFVPASGAQEIAIGDFNGNGIEDLVTANGASNNVSVLLGSGTGSFGAKTDFGTGLNAQSVALGDFNNDTNLDLVTANSSGNSVSVLLGTGTGTFGAKTDFTTASGPQSVAVGDFNRDGNDDLATANDGTLDTLSVLLGNGAGGFGAKTDFPLATGFSPREVAVGDLNGDGAEDLVNANANAGLSLLLGTGTGSFGPRTDLLVAPSAGGVAVGDLDADGKQDLVSAALSGDNMTVLRNTSAPLLQRSASSLGFGQQPLGTVSAPQALTISNLGEARLRVTRAATGGANPDDFLVTSDSCTGRSVPVGASCQVRVRFAPTAGGNRSSALVLESDAPGSPHSVPFAGDGGSLPQGPAGPAGPAGPTGSAGPEGPPGRNATVRCAPTRTNLRAGQRRITLRIRCAVSLVSAVSGARVHARLSRRGVTFAVGSRRTRRGRLGVPLRSWRGVRRGRYTLTLVFTDPSGWKVRMTKRVRIR